MIGFEVRMIDTPEDPPQVGDVVRIGSERLRVGLVRLVGSRLLGRLETARGFARYPAFDLTTLAREGAEWRVKS